MAHSRGEGAIPIENASTNFGGLDAAISFKNRVYNFVGLSRRARRGRQRTPPPVHGRFPGRVAALRHGLRHEAGTKTKSQGIENIEKIGVYMRGSLWFKGLPTPSRQPMEQRYEYRF